ncbi:hypothetical protein RSAG8_09153, partial [Rhizoctonia solani AG-8 WAC10335]
MVARSPWPFFLLLAWINTLYEHQGISVDPRVVAQFESDLSHVETLPVESTDPALKIGRIVVQGCWRHTTYVWLYMTPYGAHSKNPRVEVLKALMRLANGVSVSLCLKNRTQELRRLKNRIDLPSVGVSLVCKSVKILHRHGTITFEY